MNHFTPIAKQKPADETIQRLGMKPPNNWVATAQLDHDLDGVICSFIEPGRVMAPVFGDWLTDDHSRKRRQGGATTLVMEQEVLIREGCKSPVTFLHAGDEVDDVRTRVESDGGW